MRVKTKRVPETTNNLTKAIVTYLLVNGHSASRINTQGQYDQVKRAWRKSGSRKGFCDIVACLAPRGRFLAIEIKTGDDKLREDQISFREEILRTGGLWLEIKHYSDFTAWFENECTKHL